MAMASVTLEEGEPAAGPWRVVPVSTLAQQLMTAAGAPVGRPRIIAVDGRGGAGKTQLVQQLTTHVPASAAVHTDDLAWHQSFFGWAETLADDVLEPLREGLAVDHRPPAWAERGRPGSIEVPAGLQAVWVEGCGVLRRELAPLLDASVWMQVDRQEAHRRLLARDGDSPAQLQLIEDWDREERPRMLQEQPWRHATVVVAAGSAWARTPPGSVAIAPPVD